MSEQALNTNPPILEGYTWRDWVAFFLFWSWNLIFLAFMGFGFAPTLLPEVITAARTGSIPPEYIAYVLGLTLIPLGAVLLGATLLRREPMRLLRLGYVVEGPLMLLMAVRLFLIRQATPAVTALLLVALLGMAAFLWDLIAPQGKRLPWLRLVGLTLMGIVSLYAAAWMLFYAIPLGVEAVRWLGNLLSTLPDVLRELARDLGDVILNQPYMLLFIVFGFILMLYTASLFIVAPFAVPYFSLSAWWRGLKRLIPRRGWLAPALLSAATLVLTVALFVWANRQPQAQAFALLENPPDSPTAARQLLQRSETIRTGLLNAYLAPYRYLSAVGEVVHVSSLYESSLKMSRPQAFKVQSLYESLARPMLYKPVEPQTLANWSDNRALVKEPAQAADLYQQFFDEPINDGERQTIVAAVRSTWQAGNAEAAWQAVDDREVHLMEQDLTVSPRGDWAELELHEAYQNQTGQLQEVVYYFSLPESAVITGLWLGNTPDKSQAFSYQIAPRGAAQAVYREQTRIQKDPALIEQIGPSQYRLRAFPVPTLDIEYHSETGRSTVEDAPPLHLWLTWREMAQDGAWPLPQLAEHRNVFWDNHTARSVDGGKMDVPEDEWLPESLPAPEPAPAQPHRSDLPGGQTVLAIPANQVDLPQPAEDLRLAVVLDRSRSMESLSDEVKAALDSLAAYDQPDKSVDVYLTASAYRGEGPQLLPLSQLSDDDLINFGGQNAAELLAQFEGLRGGRQYDAAIVLTDGSGYELGESPVEAPLPDVPVWMVHLGGALPLGYDDATLAAIQTSGGGVTTQVDQALQRLALVRSQPDSPDMLVDAPALELVDGYLWVTLPTQAIKFSPYASAVSGLRSDPDFAPLAARSLILAEAQRSRGAITELETLDYLHALAQEYGIVSPYSSMLVLVDAQQQALLDRLMKGEDRFDREVEQVGETTPASPVPLAGVPEPHEWLLLGLAAAFLICLGYTKRTQIPAFSRR
jgi:putative PEP-CTERM system integral membrane protein